MLIESDTDFSICTMLGFNEPGDGGGGVWYWDSTSTATVNIGTVVKPTATVGAGRWIRTYDAGAVNVRWFGAKGDGATDDTDAFQGAFDYVDSQGGGAVYMPPGVYRKGDAAESGWTMYSNTTLKGDGDMSVIFWDDTAAQVRSGNDMLSCSDTSNITFDSFKVSGTALTELTETNQKQCLRGVGVENLRMTNVTISGTRYMATSFTGVIGGYFAGNYLEYIVRDGIRCANSWNIVVTGNRFKSVTDDCVALNALDAEALPGSGFVVTGNTFEACQGIKLLGAKSVSVTNNIFKRSLRTPIYIGFLDDGTAGNTPQFSINVSNNVINDTFTDRGTQTNILITQDIGRATGGVGTQPSVNSIYTPYTYLNDLSSGSPVIIGQFAISVTGNIIATTLGATSNYSDYGYGELFDREDVGFISDPAIVASTFGGTGIKVSAPVNGLQVSSNNVSGLSSSFTAILLDTTTATNFEDFGDTVVSSNIIFNCPGVGIGVTGTGSGNMAKQIHIINNVINLDPFFLAATHNSDNTWSASGSCVGINTPGADGLVISGNIFKNMGSTGLTLATSLVTHPNIIYSDFLAAGDNATNKGVRGLPSAAQNTIIKIDGDPLSATFTQTISVPYLHASAMPASGYYVTNAFVRNSSPAELGSAASKYSVIGWYRDTTGSSNVLNTDWFEVRGLTGN